MTKDGRMESDMKKWKRHSKCTFVYRNMFFFLKGGNFRRETKDNRILYKKKLFLFRYYYYFVFSFLFSVGTCVCFLFLSVFWTTSKIATHPFHPSPLSKRRDVNNCQSTPKKKKLGSYRSLPPVFCFLFHACCWLYPRQTISAKFKLQEDRHSASPWLRNGFVMTQHTHTHVLVVNNRSFHLVFLRFSKRNKQNPRFVRKEEVNESLSCYISIFY